MRPCSHRLTTTAQRAVCNALLMSRSLNWSPLLANVYLRLRSGPFLPIQVWEYLFNRVGAGLITASDYIVGSHFAGLDFAFAEDLILDGNVERGICACRSLMR